MGAGSPVVPAHVRSTRGRWTVLALAGGVLCVAVVASLAIGSRPVPPADVLRALTGGDVAPADAAAVVGLRLPRTVLGLLVGAALATAGAVIQSLTRNPLADPGILGVTAGSGFAVAMAIAVLGVTTPSGYVWFALGGAFLATVAVYLVGTLGRGRIDVAQMLLGGMALTAVLAGIVSAIRLTDPQHFSALLVWESGSLQARGWDVVVPVLPFVLLGLLAAPLLGPALNALALGDDVASSLGTPVTLTRVGCVAVVAVLAGSATALAGPIAFVGLMVPHAARWVAGPDQRWILALSAVLGPVLVLASDIVARVILWPGEVPVGVVMAFLGAPVLIALVRHRRLVAL